MIILNTQYYSLVELREYKIKPRNRSAFWENYRDIGLPIQLKYLPNPLGFYFVEIGQPNSFIHMWGYDSEADRQNKRSRLHLDAGWHEYVRSAHSFIEEINIRFLRQQSFTHGKK